MEAAGGQLEAALLLIMQRHHHHSLHQRKITDREKIDAVRSAARVADLLVATVDGGAQELYINERRIEIEARALLATIARYKKQTDQWLAATNAINSVLKVYSSSFHLLFLDAFLRFMDTTLTRAPIACSFIVK
ncbi:Os12g0111900 [Oryza sativa Japonica Group]|uniref:Biogenesis of lysosome-related organelles complex 1 subunit 1 n=1 Tax=Oryza sativa subsp. japonica TaxID=39947 RepID=A0A0P0Y6C6_ORYSJ|nr:Os12g0111900 [Oryza sativa Japonica Group]